MPKPKEKQADLLGDLRIEKDKEIAIKDARIVELENFIEDIRNFYPEIEDYDGYPLKQRKDREGKLEPLKCPNCGSINAECYDIATLDAGNYRCLDCKMEWDDIPREKSASQLSEEESNGFQKGY